MNKTTLKIDGLVLRPVERSDAARFAILCNDQLLARNTARIPHPYSIEDARAFVKRAEGEFNSGKEYRFAVCRNDAIVACCGVIPAEEKNCELGYWVGADEQGRGVATRAASAVVTFAFEVVGAEKITAGHFVDNPASRRVLEKLGFETKGEIITLKSLARDAEVETARLALARVRFTPIANVQIER